MGFQFRFHPLLARCRSLVETGAIGSPSSVRAHWGSYLPDWHPWEDYRKSYAARADLGGGVILTLCHPFDYLRFLCGELTVVSASARPAPSLGLSVDSCAEIGVESAGGAVGTIALNYFEKPVRHFVELVGTDGTLVCDAEAGTLTHTARGAEAQTWTTPEGFSRNDMFLDEAKHFIEIARRGAEPACSLEDGIRALEMAYEARRMADIN